MHETGLSRGNLSLQTSRLVDAGLVDLERELVGRRPRSTYSLTERGIEVLRDYKRTMRALLRPLPD